LLSTLTVNRTNSTQSVRIRNLENEGSRLLAENLSLREQVIQLQSALEQQSTGASVDNINAVRDKLEAKIQELGGLVAELGQIQNPERQRRCKSQTAATRRSPGERNWGNGAGFNLDGEDGRLPTITEDKYYPRKTMKYVSIRSIRTVHMLIDLARTSSAEYSKTQTPSLRILDRRQLLASIRKSLSSSILVHHQTKT
jgi:hypothetical protein